MRAKQRPPIGRRIVGAVTRTASECRKMSVAVAHRVLNLSDLAATERLAARLAARATPGDAILLEGSLGVGKTALARAFLRAASGAPALEVPSPSFTLVQSYDTRLGPVHHFDLWRLEIPGSLVELGWQEATQDIVLVEWPDRLGALRPTDALTVTLAFGEGDRRQVTLSGWPGRIEHLA